MNQRDLSSLLFIDQVNPEELSQVVLESLGTAAYESESEDIFHHPGQPPALHFVFAEDRLRTVKARPGLSVEDITNIQAKIRNDLLNLDKKITVRMVLFSAYPLTGHMRVVDSIQICPVPGHAPRPNDPTEGDNPFLIEFDVFDSPNLTIRMNRIYSHAKKLSLFLGVIVERRVMFPSTSSHFRWVTRADPKSPYEHMLEGYSYDQFKRQQDCFTDCNDVPPLELVEDKKYFKRVGYEGGRSLQLPNLFDQLLNIFLRLKPPHQDKFLRAAYWYSIALAQESDSARFLHLIQCIEALLPRAGWEQKCPTCRRQVGKSRTQRFTEFLDELVPHKQKLARATKRIYKLRSDLSHGWDIYGRDFLRSFTPKSADQVLQTYDSYQLARFALINWLLLIGLTPKRTTSRRSWVRGRPRQGREGSGRPPSGCVDG